MPEFALGFKAFALAHPEVGEPLTGEYDASPFTIQVTTTGMLAYEPVHRAIGFLESGADTVVNADGVRLRDGPGLGYPILAELAAGTNVHVLFAATVQGDGYDWSYCHVLSGEGWIASEYLGQVAPDGELTNEPDHLFAFSELWPAMQAAGAEFGFDAQVLAAIVDQESGFRNWLLHHDGQGRGLLGLDPRGLLPSFAEWSGLDPGPNSAPNSLPPVLQLRYAAKALADYSGRLGGPYNAARAWHRGERQWQDEVGDSYETLIRALVEALFG